MYESPTIPSRLLLWVYTNPGPTRLLRKRDTLHRAWHAAHVLPALRADVPPTLFLACSRWVAADGATPTYLSLYDLARHRSDRDSNSDGGNGGNEGRERGGGGGGSGLLWHDPAYVALSEKHAGEARAAASFVEGRVYEPLASPFPLPPPLPSWNDNSSGTDESDCDYHGGERGEGGRGRTRYISVIEVDLHAFAEGEFCRWYDEEHIPLLARVPGWVRSRRYVLKEKLGVGTSNEEEVEGVEEGAEAERGLDGHGVATATMVDTDTDADTDTDTDTGSEGGNRDGDAREGKIQTGRGRGRNLKGAGGKTEDGAGADRPPKFLAIHEWASLDAFETKQYRRATNTPWRTAVLKEERVLRYEIRVFRAA